MKTRKVLLLVFAVLVLAGLACSVPNLPFLPTATATPTPVPTPEPVLGIDVPVVVRGLGLTVTAIFRMSELTDAEGTWVPNNPDEEWYVVWFAVSEGDMRSTNDWPNEGPDTPAVVAADGTILDVWERVYFMDDGSLVMTFIILKSETTGLTLRLPDGVSVPLPETAPEPTEPTETTPDQPPG